MAFKMTCSPNDEKLFHNYNNSGDQNIVTLGRGSYTSTFNLSLQFGKMHVLGGRFCSVASEIYFSIGGNHNYNNVSTYPFNAFSEKLFGLPRFNYVSKKMTPYSRQVIFGNDVWMGRGVTIRGGVKIGSGAVIGANAVVAKDIPPYAIAVGNPARVIKYRFDAETIKKFLAVKWWNWDLKKIADNRPLMGDVEKFLEAHYSPALEEYPDDEFTQKLNNFVGGGIERTTSSQTFKQTSRFGQRLYKISRKQSYKIPRSSFGSTRTRRTKTLKL